MELSNPDAKGDKFNNAFRLFNVADGSEEELPLGINTFTFTFGTLTRTITFEVVENPSIITNWIQIGNKVYYPESVGNHFVVNPDDFVNVVNVPVFVDFKMNSSLEKLRISHREIDYINVYDNYEVLGLEQTFSMEYDEDEDEILFVDVTDLTPRTILLGYLNYLDPTDSDNELDFKQLLGETIYIEFELDTETDYRNLIDFTSETSFDQTYASSITIDFTNETVNIGRFNPEPEI